MTATVYGSGRPGRTPPSEHHSVPSYNVHIAVNNPGIAALLKTRDPVSPASASSASPPALTLSSAACRQPSAHPEPATNPDQIAVRPLRPVRRAGQPAEV